MASSMQCLSRALRDENPKFLMAASTLLLPFQPLMVSAVHTGIMEASSSKLMASYQEYKKTNLVLSMLMHMRFLSNLYHRSIFWVDQL
jgi:hypothetical protein